MLSQHESEILNDLDQRLSALSALCANKKNIKKSGLRSKIEMAKFTIKWLMGFLMVFIL